MCSLTTFRARLENGFEYFSFRFKGPCILLPKGSDEFYRACNSRNVVDDDSWVPLLEEHGLQTGLLERLGVHYSLRFMVGVRLEDDSCIRFPKAVYPYLGKVRGHFAFLLPLQCSSG